LVTGPRPWAAREIKLLGTMLDHGLGRRLRTSCWAPCPTGRSPGVWAGRLLLYTSGGPHWVSGLVTRARDPGAPAKSGCWALGPTSSWPGSCNAACTRWEGNAGACRCLTASRATGDGLRQDSNSLARCPIRQWRRKRDIRSARLHRNAWSWASRQCAFDSNRAGPSRVEHWGKCPSSPLTLICRRLLRMKTLT
jgi:hypothetical protein